MTPKHESDALAAGYRLDELERRRRIDAHQRETNRLLRERFATQQAIDRQAHINRTMVALDQQARHAAQSGHRVDLVRMQQQLDAAVRGPLPEHVVTMAQPAGTAEAETLVKALAEAYVNDHPGTTYAVAVQRVLSDPLNAALAAAYHGRATNVKVGPSRNQADGVLLLKMRVDEARQNGRPFDQLRFETADLPRCNAASLAVINAAIAMQKDWHERGLSIELVDAVDALRRTRPDLFEALRPSETSTRYVARD